MGVPTGPPAFGDWLAAAIWGLLADEEAAGRTMCSLIDAARDRLLLSPLTDLPAAPEWTADTFPWESCKLATAFVASLCCPVGAAPKRTALAFTTRSLGPFTDVVDLLVGRTLIPARNGKAVRAEVARWRASCEASVGGGAQDGDGALLNTFLALSVRLVDSTAVLRMIFPGEASLAHSFVLIVGTTGDSAHLFQSFGPPDVGYTLRTWVEATGGRVHLPTFLDNLEAVIESSIWDVPTAAAYAAAFGTPAPHVPLGYHVLPYPVTQAVPFATADAIASVAWFGDQLVAAGGGGRPPADRVRALAHAAGDVRRRREVVAAAPGGWAHAAAADVIAGHLAHGRDRYKMHTERQAAAVDGRLCDGCGGVVGVEDRPLRVCAACRKARYCTRGCQVADWRRRHRAVCQANATV